MKGQRFNSQEHAKLKHRAEQLRARIMLDKGPEQETAKRLLEKVEKKIKEYEKTYETHETFKQTELKNSVEQEYTKLKHSIEQLRTCIILYKGERQEIAKKLLERAEEILKSYEKMYDFIEQNKENNSTCSDSLFWEFWEEWIEERQNIDNWIEEQQEINSREWNPNPNFKWNVRFHEENIYHEDSRSENEMIDDLEILYMIFGSTYVTKLNYHIYKIRFKKHADKQGAFYRVYSDVYEDNIRICKDVIIGFWPFRFGNDRCGDMEFSSMSKESVEKYNNGCNSIYLKILDGLKDVWNTYFDEQNSTLALIRNVDGYIESNTSDVFFNIKVQLNEIQRKEIIERTEEQINNGKMSYLKLLPIEVMAYKPFYSLADFLERSGVVYQVNFEGVYIWNDEKNEYEKLVDYDYDRIKERYYIYLL